VITVADAKHRLLSGLSPVGSEIVEIGQAGGRILAGPVIAQLTRPAADTSAMDGYAVRSADLCGDKVELREIDHIPAGQLSQRTLAEGDCARIFTGAQLPDGSDSILIQEDADRRDGSSGTQIVTVSTVNAGEFVRRKGMDFSVGDALIEPGRRLTARDVGLLAAANIPWVTVRRKPRIAILATGDEIVLPGEPVGPGQIVGSAGHALASMVTSCGGEPLLLGVARDEPNALARAASNAHGCDFLVTIGGASVGDYDLVHDVLGAEGSTIEFQKIAMRPGKPLMFGTSGTVRLLGLPGNPVSSYVCGLLFLRPAMNVLQNCPQDDELIHMPTLEPLVQNGVREHYMRARTKLINGDPHIVPFGDQDSSLVATLARADGLIVRPANAPAAAAGDTVPVVPFRDGPADL